MFCEKVPLKFYFNNFLMLSPLKLFILQSVRGAMVEWLERLAVVRKVAGSSPARAKWLENSHSPPSSKWVPD